DLTDFRLFMAAYEAGNGAGSFAAMASGSPVPEPTSMILVLSCAALLATRRYLGKWGVRSLVLLVGLGVLGATSEVATAEILPGSRTNHALGSTATQSSQFGNGVYGNIAVSASVAVDGTYN